MDRRTYRKNRLASDYAKAHRVRVAQAHKEIEIIEKLCSAFGPLTPFQRNKVYRVINIMFEPEPPKRKIGFKG